MSDEIHALEQVKLRNDFYKDSFRYLVWILLISAILNIVLAVGLLSSSKIPPEKFFFAITDDGQMIPLHPTTQPVVTQETILNWVSNNVPTIYNLDFIHYRSQLNSTQQYFTPEGWKQFQAAYSPQLNSILSNKYISSAALDGVPVITGTGLFNGTYMWQVQMRLILSFVKGSEVTTQRVLLTVVISRVNNVAAHQLLGISSIIQTVQ